MKSTTLNLFEQDTPTSPATSIAPLQLPTVSFYPRYGLAVALVQAQLKVGELNESNVREVLAQALETGLSHFRMKTDEDPNLTRLLTFAPLSLGQLEADANLIQSAGLAGRGVYLFPSLVTGDGNAKDTFKNAQTFVKDLREGKSFDSTVDLSRSFVPTTAKINNGKSSQSPPKGTLIEAACAAITTLTPYKPAAWPGQDKGNTVIIPDLPLNDLCDFIALFQRMEVSDTENLMQWKLKDLPPVAGSDKPKRVSKKASEAKHKSEFHRPRLHNGNYPFAPRDAGVFGAVGLLGAIGRWAHTANEVAWAEKVLNSIVDKPLYIISYDKISQARFGHHVVGLALNGNLSQIIDDLYQGTRLYADLESPYPRRDLPAYQIFYLMTSRFLQQFTPVTFTDFLATRAEYPPRLQTLFKEYFMSENTRKDTIDLDIVQSAGVLGRWLNSTAYFVADGEVDTNAGARDDKVRKAKAKILVEFESAAMSAKSPTDLLFRVSTRCGRLLQNDAPAGAKRFMDATASGEIDQQEAVHLLVAYMRLRSGKREVTDPSTDPTPQTDDANPMNTGE